jgi:general L-amino acid transport system permease protein
MAGGDAPQRNPIARLWYDKETRSIIMQILTIVGLLLFFGYIITNAIENLKLLGKTFSFSFLFDPASYDINQHLISYSSTSTHLRAGVVGILNTLLVAVCGIILATILGFIMGVLRLSPNWLINRLVYCIIEFVRNVPVLLHILLVHGIIVHALPQPRGLPEWANIGDKFFLTNRGLFMPSPIFESLFWVVVAAFVFGIGFSWWFKRHAKKVQDETGRILPVFWTSVGAIIGLPILAYLVTGMPVAWDDPELGTFNLRGGMTIRPEFMALWLALSVYTACFIAEIVRAGILAVSKGQWEASQALGASRGLTLRSIIIPQALRVIVPPLTSQYLNLTKNSSLAIAIGYMDVVATIGGISLMQTGKEMETMIIVLLFYLIVSAGRALGGGRHERSNHPVLRAGRTPQPAGAHADIRTDLLDEAKPLLQLAQCHTYTGDHVAAVAGHSSTAELDVLRCSLAG